MANDCDNDVCENSYDDDGNQINNGNGDSDSNSGCVTTPSGQVCPDLPDASCRPWQLSRTNDNCFIDNLVDESLGIGGADLNVFKLLGVHEQGRLVDLTGNGSAISGGDAPSFPKSEAFTPYVTEWRSAQKGQAVVTSAYIGYDFGIIKLDNGRNRYSVDTSIKHNIASIKIKQGTAVKNRATQVRVERSADGMKWYGAAILTLPNDDCLNTIHFRNTVPMRYWRLRPLAFNGGDSDPWIVQALELFDYDLRSIEDIQDKIWNENRDRDYANQTIPVKGYYDLIEVDTDLARFGIELPSQIFSMKVAFNAAVASLGRPFVIGDIIEIPAEQQYDPDLNAVKKYMEVTDVAWATEGYTPGWQPTLQRLTLQPMIASQETADIFGGLESYQDDDGFLRNFDDTHGMEDGQHPIFQDYSDVRQTIDETSTDEEHLPERGRDNTEITEFSEEQKQAAAEQGVKDAQGNPTLGKVGTNSRQLYVEDGLPPNELPYTTGDEFPASPSNGDYHRLTYTGFDDIPARLFRYSAAKNRWIFMESDKRALAKETKPRLQEFLGSTSRVKAEDIGK